MSTVTVEGVGVRRYLLGVAVPFRKPTTLWDDATRGVVVESFDERSFRSIDVAETIPLLVHHDPSRPIGRITRVRHSADGLRVEAKLAASPDELAGIAARIDAGVQAGLSVGALANKAKDVWTRSEATGLPRVLRRDAQLVEVSLCTWPAYRDAQVLELRHQSIGSPEDTEAELEALERRLRFRRLDDRLARIGVHTSAG